MQNKGGWKSWLTAKHYSWKSCGWSRAQYCSFSIRSQPCILWFQVVSTVQLYTTGIQHIVLLNVSMKGSLQQDSFWVTQYVANKMSICCGWKYKILVLRSVCLHSKPSGEQSCLQWPRGSRVRQVSLLWILYWTTVWMEPWIHWQRKWRWLSLRAECPCVQR